MSVTPKTVPRAGRVLSKSLHLAASAVFCLWAQLLLSFPWELPIPSFMFSWGSQRLPTTPPEVGRDPRHSLPVGDLPSRCF